MPISPACRLPWCRTLVLLLLFAALELWKLTGMLLVSVIAALVLYLLYQDGLHRFLSCMMVIGCTVVCILEARQFFWFHPVTLVLVGGVILLLRKQWYRSLLRPLFHALLFSLPLLYFLVLLPKIELDTPWLISNLIITAALLLMYRWMRNENAEWRSTRPVTITVVVAILLLGFFSTPGLLVSIGLAVLGYRLGEKPVLTVGIVFLPIYIIVFYYNMSMPLSQKALTLAAAGSVLLLLRHALRHRWGFKESL